MVLTAWADATYASLPFKPIQYFFMSKMMTTLDILMMKYSLVFQRYLN